MEFLVLRINFFTSLNIFEKSFKFICSDTLHISFLYNTIFFNPYLFLLNFLNFNPNLLRLSIWLQLRYFSSKFFNPLFPLINNIIPRLKYLIIGKSFYHVLKIKVRIDVYVVLRLTNIYVQCYAGFPFSELWEFLIKGLDDGHNYFYLLCESIIMYIDYVIELIISFIAHKQNISIYPNPIKTISLPNPHPYYFPTNPCSSLIFPYLPLSSLVVVLGREQKQRQGGSWHVGEKFGPGGGQGGSWGRFGRNIFVSGLLFIILFYFSIPSSSRKRKKRQFYTYDSRYRVYWLWIILNPEARINFIVIYFEEIEIIPSVFYFDFMKMLFFGTRWQSGVPCFYSLFKGVLTLIKLTL